MPTLKTKVIRLTQSVAACVYESVLPDEKGYKFYIAVGGNPRGGLYGPFPTVSEAEANARQVYPAVIGGRV